MKLLCFEAAGSSSSMFWSLKKSLKGKVDVIPIEYPGHGEKFNEPLLTSMDNLVNFCYEFVPKEEDFCFLGYSMGAWVAYELYFKLHRNFRKLPNAIFFCSQESPFTDRNIYTNIQNMTDKKFLKYLISLGGIPEELQNFKIFSIFSPILRNDYQIVEQYILKENKKQLLTSKIVVIYGEDDWEVALNINDWGKASFYPVNYHKLKGGHFFINNNIKEVSEIILEELKRGDLNGK